MTTATLPPEVSGRLVIPSSAYSRDRRPWLRERRHGLGGSEVAAVLGLSEYDTAMDVYLSKIEDGDPVDVSPGEAAAWGLRLERAIADEFQTRHAKALGVRVRPSPGLIAHPEHDWLRATVDRLLEDRDTGKIVAVLELKTAGHRVRYQWDDGVPLPYQIQVQVQLAVTGLPYGYLVVLHAGQEMPQPYRIDRDEAAIAAIIENAGAFWHDHVVPRIPPDPTERDLATLPAVFPGDKDADAAVLEDSLVDRLRLRARITRRIEDLESARDRIDAAVKGAMRDATKAVDGDGEPAATWSRFPQKRLDAARLKAEQPDVWARYARETTGQRFTIAKRLKEAS